MASLEGHRQSLANAVDVGICFTSSDVNCIGNRFVKRRKSAFFSRPLATAGRMVEVVFQRQVHRCLGVQSRKFAFMLACFHGGHSTCPHLHGLGHSEHSAVSLTCSSMWKGPTLAGATGLLSTWAEETYLLANLSTFV